MLAGVGAALVFATAHAFIIVPIWDRMTMGLIWGALAGGIGAWAFAELYPGVQTVGRSAWTGARYGGLLWLLVAPVSLVDAALRWLGVLPRLELLGVAIALLMGTSAGVLFGRYRVGTKRGMVAGGAATLMLLIAMAGPVPIGRSPRAFGIFLSVLPSAIIGGAIVGAAVSLSRGRQSRGAIAEPGAF
jgi:hypothetical protein